MHNLLVRAPSGIGSKKAAANDVSYIGAIQLCRVRATLQNWAGQGI